MVVAGEGYRPNMVVHLLSLVSWPVAGALCLAVSAVWWLRLPSDLESADLPEDELVEDAEGNELDGADDREEPAGESRGGSDGSAPARAEERGDHPKRRPVPSARERRQADRDDVLLLDGVEQIEPVERLTPREPGSGDGSSGYDDYFRRF